MPEPSSFRYSQPLQVNLENIPQRTKHDAYSVPYQILVPQSSDSQGYPTMYTRMTDESQDALLPSYTYGQQQFSQPVQYIAQPGSRYISQIKRERHVSDYLGLSIFTTFCCCLPLGIWAIIESNRARKLAGQGRYADAQKNSRCALNLNIASLILGAILIAVLIIYKLVLKQNNNDP
ncbi:synapse differentiation-inducing gene protein 1 [Biomphalaria glabrata]|nr:synapse differentiation-inducing gene protein 1 [Biomphalaria glabrata]